MRITPSATKSLEIEATRTGSSIVRSRARGTVGEARRAALGYAVTIERHPGKGDVGGSDRATPSRWRMKPAEPRKSAKEAAHPTTVSPASGESSFSSPSRASGRCERAYGFRATPDEGRTQQAVLDRVAGLHFLDDRAGLGLVVRNFDHRLVEMRIELLPIASMRAMPWRWKALVELAPGRLDAGDQALHPLVLAQVLGDGGERALEIVLHAQHVAGEAGRGILGGADFSCSSRRRTFWVSAWA
jgi:hypothetical protein